MEFIALVTPKSFHARENFVSIVADFDRFNCFFCVYINCGTYYLCCDL